MSIFSEAFKTLNLVESENFNVNDKDSSDELKKFLDGDADAQDDVEIIDADADDEEDIEDSYVGDILVQCPTCQQFFVKGEDALIRDEDDEDKVNVDDECPYCQTPGGFVIVGKIEDFESTEVDVEEKDDDESDDGKEERVEESCKRRGRRNYVKEGLISRALTNSATKDITNGLDSIGKVVGSIGNIAGKATDVVGNTIDKVTDATGINIKDALSKNDDDVKTEAVKPENREDSEAIGRAVSAKRYGHKIPTHDKEVVKKYRISKDELSRMGDDRPFKTSAYGNPTKSSKIDWVDYIQKRDKVEQRRNRESELYPGLFGDAKTYQDVERKAYNANLSKDLDDMKNALSRRKGAYANAKKEYDNLDAREAEVKDVYDRVMLKIKNDREQFKNGTHPAQNRITSARRDVNDILDKHRTTPAIKNEKLNANHFKRHNTNVKSLKEADEPKKFFKEYEIRVDGRVYERSYTLGRANYISKYFKDNGREVEVIPKKVLIRGNFAIKNRQRLIDEQELEYKDNVNESLNEDVQNVNIETDTETITVANKVDTTKEMVAPIGDEEIREIPTQDELDAENIEEPTDVVDDVADETNVDVDDFDDEAFDGIGESLLRKTYSNVESFKTTEHKIDGNNIVVEGNITFKSGKVGKTRFNFESKKLKNGKYIFEGKNTDLTESDNPFSLRANLNGKKMIAESMVWNFKAKDEDGSIKKVCGIAKH